MKNGIKIKVVDEISSFKRLNWDWDAVIENCQEYVILDSVPDSKPEANLLSSKSTNWVQPIPTPENRKGNTPNLAKRKALRAKRKKR